MKGLRLYYTAPPQGMFDEIKREAIKIWQTYDDTHGYASEKINSIQPIANFKDNYMYIVAMFDDTNRTRLLNAVNPHTAHRIIDAMMETES